jgi:hypothetical protein
MNVFEAGCLAATLGLAWLGIRLYQSTPDGPWPAWVTYAGVTGGLCTAWFIGQADQLSTAAALVTFALVVDAVLGVALILHRAGRAFAAWRRT